MLRFSRKLKKMDEIKNANYITWSSFLQLKRSAFFAFEKPSWIGEPLSLAADRGLRP